MDPGLYFSWGNTIGEPYDSDYAFTASLYSETSGYQLTEDIPLTEDAARLTLGGSWRMPSAAECQELLDNTVQRWTMKDGVQGMLLTSTINGQSLFFPAAGYIGNGRHVSVGSEARLWSKTYIDATLVFSMLLRQENSGAQSRSNRYPGYPVRAVRDD